MAHVFVSSVIAATPAQVWEIVRGFNGLPQWHPAVVESEIADGGSPDRVGCERVFRQRTGDVIRERLVALDDRNYVQRYAIIEAPLPATDYLATLRLLPVTDGMRTYIEWVADFHCASALEADLVSGLSALFQEGFDALKTRLER